MIDEKKINEAARAYCDATYGTLKEEPFIAEGFRQGAKWAQNEFIKSLWHDASEEPKKNKQCLVEIIYPRPCGLPDDIDYTTSYYANYSWNEYNFRFSHYKVIRWLYIDDILPKEGGEG